MYTTHIIIQFFFHPPVIRRSYVLGAEPARATALLHTEFLYYTFFSPSAWYNNIVCYDRIINELLVITLTSIRTNKYVFLYLKNGEEKKRKSILITSPRNFYYVKITDFWVNKKSLFGKK